MFAVAGASKSLDGRLLWTGIDLELEQGQICAISGPSGTGKSTFLRALAGLDALDSGDLLYDEHTYEQIGPTLWRRNISYATPRLPNNPGFTDTPPELAERVASLSTVRNPEIPQFAQQLAEQWGIDDQTWDKPWAQLSTGQGARCALAITLATQPQVLLLDEPTASLDPSCTLLVEKSLRECGCTVIIVTHDPEQVTRIADCHLELLPDAKHQFNFINRV